jgi:hypothetical protein
VPAEEEKEKEMEKATEKETADSALAGEHTNVDNAGRDKSLTPPSVPPLALGALRRSGGGGGGSARPDDANDTATEGGGLHQTGTVAINEKRAEAMRQLMRDLEAAASKRAHEAEEAAAAQQHEQEQAEGKQREDAVRERDEEQRLRQQQAAESDKLRQQHQNMPYENDDDVGKITDSDRARIRSRPQSTELNLIVCRICEQVTSTTSVDHITSANHASCRVVRVVSCVRLPSRCRSTKWRRTATCVPSTPSLCYWSKPRTSD